MKPIQYIQKSVLASAILATSLPAFAELALEEIVVTAERKSASIQDTAAAITAHSGEKLVQMGVTSPVDLTVTTPGLKANATGGNTQFYIRGVGNLASNAFGEGAVSFNLDGVYISRSTTYQGLFYDLERIEVLKGPQGTLYGRNSTGGAINLISKRPELTAETSGYISAERGNYNLWNLNGAVNLPVSENSAVRIAGQSIERDGYFDDGTDDADSKSLRISGNYDGDNFSALVIIDSNTVDQTGPGSTIVGPNSAFSTEFLDSDPWSVGGLSSAVDSLLTDPSHLPFNRGPLALGTAVSPLPKNQVANHGIVAELNWETPLGSATFIPSYRTTDVDNHNYVPGFLIDVEEDAEQTSLEFRLANTNGNLDWVAGLYYFDEDINDNSFYFQDLPFFNAVNTSGLETANSTASDIDLETKSKAIFAEGTYALSDSLRLKLGARYTQEEKLMRGESTITAPTGPVPPFAASYTINLIGNDIDDNQTTWKAGIEYDLNEDNFVYVTVSSGFKAGGYYIEEKQYGNSFAAESIKAYALGSKNILLNGALRLNAELFHWDYTDHQESHLANSAAGYTLFKTENIGNATIQGLDLELEYLITARDKINFQGQWLDATFDDFSYTAYSPAGAPLTGCSATATSATNYLLNCDGYDAIRAPQWSFNISYEHTFYLESAGEITLGLRTSVSDKTYTNIDYLPSQLADDYTRTDIHLGYTSPDGTWNAAIWGRNLENDATVTNGFVSPFTDLAFSPLMPPRTYGAKLTFNF